MATINYQFADGHKEDVEVTEEFALQYELIDNVFTRNENRAIKRNKRNHVSLEAVLANGWDKADQLVDVSIKSSKPWYNAFVNFCGEVKKRDDEILEILVRNHIPEKHWERYLNADTYLNDMYRRMGNQILNYARVYKKKEKPALGRLANKRIRQKTTADILLKSAQMQAGMEADAMYFFREYLRKLEEVREENVMEEVNEMA